MKKSRLFFSLLLCGTLMLGAAVPAAVPAVPAAAAGQARLYNVYGDHMLFQQNAEAVFAGVAAPGTALGVTLTDASGAAVRTARGTAGADGTFRLSFAAPAGGYDAYTVTLSAGGAAVQTLSDVVFGELWLAFGQSNMEYGLLNTPEGKAMVAAGQTGSRNLRVLQVDHPTKDGAYCSDKLPQTEAQSCRWYTADKTDVYFMSGVAFFFANKLIDMLDMPVGILNVAVGGSAIGAWIPRDTIENDAALKQSFVGHDAYIALGDWDGGARQYHMDMSGLYNSKVAPLVNFRPAGGIWYQGETDLMLYDDVDYYCRMFDALQDTYGSLFGSQGRFPMVFTQIAAYDYNKGPYAVTKFNQAFTRLAQADPATRGQVTITDVSLDYYDDCGAIHPMTKKPIGERMADCAAGLMYGADQPATAPSAASVRVQGSDVLVTFSDVGDGLMCAGDTLKCFTVYGADGVCLPAEAAIEGKDTVRLHSDAVPAPAGAAYAANNVCPQANLYSSVAGSPYLPAAPFGASDDGVTKLFDDAAWLSCDTLSAWQFAKENPGMRDVWTAKNASLSVLPEGALSVTAEKRSFTLSAPFADTKNTEQERYDNVDTDFTAYGTLTLRVKNTGGADVTLNTLRLYQNPALFYCPQCTQSGKNSVAIPADGAWHEYTFDLNALGLGGAAADRWSNDVLDAVTELRACFTGSGASLQLGGFRFAPEGQQKAGGFLQRLIARVIALIQSIKNWFTNLFSK